MKVSIFRFPYFHNDFINTIGIFAKPDKRIAFVYKRRNDFCIFTVIESDVILFVFHNEINYHILKTTYYEADPSEITGLNVDALGVLINPDSANRCKEMKIKNWDAALYEFDEHSYLCWTDTPEISYVLEYSPEAVPDEEIVKMAESAETLERNK